MDLMCPSCGGRRTDPAGKEGGRTVRVCADCGYRGRMIDVDKQRKRENFLYPSLLVIFILTLAAHSLGASLEMSLLYFTLPGSVFIVFYYLSDYSRTYPVEDDLKNLDSSGNRRGAGKA